MSASLLKYATCEYVNIRTCQCAKVGMCKGNTGRICVCICKCILLTGDEWLCVGYQSDISTVDDVYEGRIVCVCKYIYRYIYTKSGKCS